MVIQLDDEYSVVSDKYNYVLKYKHTYMGVDKDNNPKKITSKDEWNFPKLSQALSVYLDCSLKSANSIQELYKELLRVENIITTIKN